MNTLVLVGNDKIGRKAISRISKIHGISIYLDDSSNFTRVCKLLKVKRIGIIPLVKIALADMFRKDTTIKEFPKILNNDELIKYCTRYHIESLFLFHAGLIINKKLISTKMSIFNVHCARLPDYGGLATLYKALKNKDYNQCATLHRVTEGIDSGEVIMTEPYQLSPQISYKKNEDIAYEAGITLLARYLKKYI